MRCPLCTDDLEHCHEVSIAHADGTTECGGDAPCALGHLLHDWRVPCVDLDPPCPCAGDDAVPLPLAA